MNIHLNDVCVCLCMHARARACVYACVGVKDWIVNSDVSSMHLCITFTSYTDFVHLFALVSQLVFISTCVWRLQCMQFGQIEIFLVFVNIELQKYYSSSLHVLFWVDGWSPDICNFQIRIIFVVPYATEKCAKGFWRI